MSIFILTFSLTTYNSKERKDKDMDSIEKIHKLLNDKDIICEEHIALKHYTTLHIGGIAQLLAKPSNIQEIQDCVKACNSYHIPYYILGKGSNVLALDKGYQGMILELSSNYHHMLLIHPFEIRVESGATLKSLCAFAKKNQLQGLEFACGIPGSVGGAICMNAGAYGGEMKDVVKEVIFMDHDGNLKTFTNEDLDFSYRHSYFSNHSGIVLEVVYSLEKGDGEEIQAKMDDLMQKRRDKQPLDAYSAGSTFKRPDDNYASALIREAGLEGFSIGDAAVSEKHTGFLINKANATSDDFLKLIDEVKKHVKAHSGYELTCEIKIISS